MDFIINSINSSVQFVWIVSKCLIWKLLLPMEEFWTNDIYRVRNLSTAYLFAIVRKCLIQAENQIRISKTVSYQLDHLNFIEQLETLSAQILVCICQMNIVIPVINQVQKASAYYITIVALLVLLLEALFPEEWKVPSN